MPVKILETLGLDVIVPKVGEKPIISSEYILKENPKYIIGTRGVKNIDGIKKGNRNFIPNLSAETIIEQGDILLVITDAKTAAELKNLK